MLTRANTGQIDPTVLLRSATKAGRAIPPAWPLASSVAVNPYLGQTNECLAFTGARLARIANAPVTMPRSWYNERIVAGEIVDEDLVAALSIGLPIKEHLDASKLKVAAGENGIKRVPLPTVADLAAEVSGLDWPGLIADRFGAWAADYFDAGQALWAAPKGKSAYSAWRAVASRDLTPEIIGLSGFASRITEAPEDADFAIISAAKELGLSEEMLETYFHQLLISLGGWGQYARYQLWQAELANESDKIVTDFLAIRLAWEAALFVRYQNCFDDRWKQTCLVHAAPLVPDTDQIIDSILQEATERSAQRKLLDTLGGKAPTSVHGRPELQAAFCIDVRSEVFRRALESVDPSSTTLGFAGFFGLATAHRRFGSDVAELRLPVLLNPGVASCSGGPQDALKDEKLRLTARAKRAWGRFKFAAVSSFAFVEAMGPAYIAELVRDTLAFSRKHPQNDPAPRFDPELGLEARTGVAEAVLRAMSLTDNFGRVVLLTGHGASVVNNPHASALQCGACGGYSGEVNARLLAGLLNDPQVRDGLKLKQIVIPDDTLFIGALHNTTTDAVTLFAEDHAAPDHVDDLVRVRDWLAVAGKLTRRERAFKLPRADGADDIERRSWDWAEVRPEWALAGCKAFIAAPRSRTSGKKLDGRAFLHDYDWRQDKGFGILELIMTAPIVVASWISLQYYGSTVSPELFGSGNKLLHNVTGGIGVVEGNGGALRAGLPWQSVHNGNASVHEPLRLTVLIEAPIEAMNDILKRHSGVRDLCDNRWIHLLALDENGRVHARYNGALTWLSSPNESEIAA